MAYTQTLIADSYAAFNRRDFDGALSLLSASGSWPKASEGGRVTGKEEIRAYWTRQWQEFDPHVEPLEILDGAGGRSEVRVHQVVKSLDGQLLSDGEVWHVHIISDGLIQRMDLKESGASAGPAPSAAFARQ